MSKEEVQRFLESRKNNSSLKQTTDNRLAEPDYITSIANQSGFKFTVEEYEEVLLEVELYLYNKEREKEKQYWMKWIMLIIGIVSILAGLISGYFIYIIIGAVILWIFMNTFKMNNKGSMK